MEQKKLLLQGLLISILGLGLMIGGCARISPSDEDQESPCILAPSPDPSADDMEAPPFNLTRHQYPEAASLPPDGYQLVQLGVKSQNRAIDDGGYDPFWDDDDWNFFDFFDFYWGNQAAKYVRKHQDAKLKLQRNKIHLKKGCVPYDTWITMTKPVPGEPWIEFEPHGLEFDQKQTVKVKIYYGDCELPEGIEPEDLEVWYWNEELGEYEYIGGMNKVNKRWIEFYIDHFSRYVVACQY